MKILEEFSQWAMFALFAGAFLACGWWWARFFTRTWTDYCDRKKW